MIIPPPRNSFHAHHSPIGAHSSFTIGMAGAVSGLALESGEPANGGVYVGVIDGEEITALPFFKPAETFETDRFDHQMKGTGKRRRLRTYQAEEITRDFRFATDSFTAGPIHLEVVSSFYPLPDPDHGDHATNKRACCPAVYARLAVDNSDGDRSITAFFILDGHGRGLSVGDAGGSSGFLTQIGQLGLATNDDVTPVQCLDFSEICNSDYKPLIHRQGGCYGFMIEVPAGEKREMTISLATFHPGTATLGIEMAYWYTRYFTNIRDVLEYSLDNRQWYFDQAAERDAELDAAELNEAQKFLVAHASHSYYGSTQWFDLAGRPFWAVNEGEYRMLNTFDLTVDMVFYEMRYSPWTVKNVLESFVRYYSYYDEVRLPGSDTLYPGGISFTHDMGVCNMFSIPRHSSYELGFLDRKCFSYMTHEQLVNWVCCAGVYVHGTSDRDFLVRHLKVLKDCYQSMVNRDHPDPAQRDGVMSCESSRCEGGGEITTYDSLDSSLGQARNSLYLAVKSWAAYLTLEALFIRRGETELAAQAQASAKLCAATLANSWNEELGFIPAVLEGDNVSAIIPAIEGLVFPKVMGLDAALAEDGPYGELIQLLKRHFQAVFRPGICLYEDHGWKLSSTADNSWMSKICLCQYVARAVLGIDFGKEQLAHDTAHMDWEIFGSTFHACSDQFTSGKAMASLYYPRIVTNILWLDEK